MDMDVETVQQPATAAPAQAADSASDEQKVQLKEQRASLVSTLKRYEKIVHQFDDVEDAVDKADYANRIVALKAQISGLKPIGAQVSTMEKSVSKLEARLKWANDKAASYQHIAEHTSQTIAALQQKIAELKVQTARDQARYTEPPEAEVIPARVTMGLMASLVTAMETRDPSNLEALLTAAKLQVQYYQASTTMVPANAENDDYLFGGEMPAEAKPTEPSQPTPDTLQAQHAAQEAQAVAAIAARQANLAAEEAAAFQQEALRQAEVQRQAAAQADALRQAEVIAEAQRQEAARLLTEQAARQSEAAEQAARLLVEQAKASAATPAPATPTTIVRSRSHSPPTSRRRTERSMSPESILRRCQEEDQELLDNL